MKTLILFYSYSGKTKIVAEKLAAEQSADIVEIKDKKRPGKPKAYTAGIVSSIRGKAWEIQPLDVDFTQYDRLVLIAPVWAGNPPPALSAFLAQLPEGKVVSVKMVSASGKSDCKERLETAIKAKSCVFEGFEDIKA